MINVQKGSKIVTVDGEIFEVPTENLPNRLEKNPGCLIDAQIKAYNLMIMDPCIIVQFIKKNPTRCNNVSKFLFFHIYMKLSVFRETHRPSSGA
jgi:hypothetical protein